MYWTLELASYLEDAPWPATKDKLIDFAIRSGAPMEVIENLQEIEDEGEAYETIEEIWPDYPTKDDFFFNKPCFNNFISWNFNVPINFSKSGLILRCSRNPNTNLWFDDIYYLCSQFGTRT